MVHRDGLIVLPPKQGRQNRPKPIVFGPDTEPPLFPTPTTLDEVRPLTLRPVVRGTREGKLWNEFIARYRLSRRQPWSAPRCATPSTTARAGSRHARDSQPPPGCSHRAITLIGWTPQLREKNLLWSKPDVPDPALDQFPNLGSHILAIMTNCPRRPSATTQPVMIETFEGLHRIYRASGWIHVGTTQGRGRYDRDKLYDKPRKDIWLRPLRSRKRTLTITAPMIGNMSGQLPNLLGQGPSTSPFQIRANRKGRKLGHLSICSVFPLFGQQVKGLLNDNGTERGAPSARAALYQPALAILLSSRAENPASANRSMILSTCPESRVSTTRSRSADFRGTSENRRW